MTGDGDDEGLVNRALERADLGARRLRERLRAAMPAPVRRAWVEVSRATARVLPKGLLGRSLLIIVVPMVVLQAVLANVFMDRHWQLVTARLSTAVVRDIGTVVELLDALPEGSSPAPVIELAARRMQLAVTIAPGGPLPDQPEPGFSSPIVERTLASELRQRVGLPFTVTADDEIVLVRLLTARGLVDIRFRESLAYAANWHIFIVWMLGTAALVTAFSILFIRNQVKPIQRLARAAEAFGKGRPVAHFVPQGAREVRQAAHAFIEMRRRIERQMDQRTTMLAGVSHDLRTMLTRLRLELALMPESEEREDMRRDVDEMEAMLEAYVAFAKSDQDEATEAVDIAGLVEETGRRAAGVNSRFSFAFQGERIAVVRPGAFRRLVVNLVDNAARYGSQIAVGVEHQGGWLTLTVEDDGPGVPDNEREAVFRPFYRLDAARNQDRTGTGLGLAIARDIARGHGGDIRLETAAIGGLKAVVRLPG